MKNKDISVTLEAFKNGARRAKEAGFDIIEIHAAHGYLINQFLSPLTNKRADKYGGSRENRYQFLQEIIQAVKTEWDGPMFVRISAHEYHANGNTEVDFIFFTRRMKALGAHLINLRSSVVVKAHMKSFP